jgi:triacylglycerol lipase
VLSALLLATLLAFDDAPAQAPGVSVPGPPVVLLHGLALTPLSLKKIEDGLKAAGYRTCAIEYPSRSYPIDTLASLFVLPAINRCFPASGTGNRPVLFVTHSLGGIVVRMLATLPGAPAIGRVVMIAPPNGGSEIADALSILEIYAYWNGPAGMQLGTDSNSVPRRLGPATFELGVIAGTAPEPFFSDWIPGVDDGKVSVESTRLEGMRDFVEIRATHTSLLEREETVRQILGFLRNGKFER